LVLGFANPDWFCVFPDHAIECIKIVYKIERKSKKRKFWSLTNLYLWTESNTLTFFVDKQGECGNNMKQLQ
jgi:hypothetical protein